MHTRLKDIREFYNLSQQEMADSLNLSKNGYWYYETGKRIPRAEELSFLKDIYNININWLLTGEGEMFLKDNKNSLDRQNDETVFEKSSQLGKRLQDIQDKHNFLDSEMAKLLKISEKDYMKIKLGKLQLDLDVLNEIKRNFVVDIDWLIYGE